MLMIEVMKKLISKDELQQQLAFLTSTYKDLSKPLTMLEGRLPLIVSGKLIEDFEKLLDSLAMATYKKGLDLALRKNPDLDYF